MEELFFTEQDAQQDKFYKMDKNLFENEIYKGLSLGAKVVYSVLKDRQSLSESNKQDWLDEKGRIFFYFDIDKLSKLLETSKTTMVKYKKELEKYKLLYQFRQGQGKPNKMYCLKPRSIDNALKLKNCNSRIQENELLEVKKLYPNDTEINYTDNIETEIIKDYRDDYKSSARKNFDEIVNDFMEIENNKLVRNVINLFFSKYRKNTGYDKHFELDIENIKSCIENIKDMEYIRKKESTDEDKVYFENLIDKYFEVNTKNNYFSLQNFLSKKKYEYLLILTEYRDHHFYEDLTEKDWN